MTAVTSTMGTPLAMGLFTVHQPASPKLLVAQLPSQVCRPVPTLQAPEKGAVFTGKRSSM
jgi:hypothetical protein